MSFADSMEDLDAMNEPAKSKKATDAEIGSKKPSTQRTTGLIAVMRRYSQRKSSTDLSQT